MIKLEVNENGKLENNVWVFSDPHYNHKNICRGTTNWRTPDGEIPISQTRNFQTLEEMNSAIVYNINSCAMPDDILICLGDWSFGGFGYIREFWDRIVCKNIHLVLGNHDHHIERNKDNIQSLFKSVSFYNTLDIGNRQLKLMHYPISSWDGVEKGVMHLHGHCHLPTHLRFGTGRRMDVGMDGHPEFRPYNLMDEIIPSLCERPKMSEIGEYDHHLDNIQNKNNG